MLATAGETYLKAGENNRSVRRSHHGEAFCRRARVALAHVRTSNYNRTDEFCYETLTSRSSFVNEFREFTCAPRRLSLLRKCSKPPVGYLERGGFTKFAWRTSRPRRKFRR